MAESDRPGDPAESEEGEELSQADSEVADGTSGAEGDGSAFPIVCLGASAGGLDALRAFFANVPDETGAAFVVVVHLSPDYESLLPDLLDRVTQMTVAAVKHRTQVEPNHVYIIPPGKTMRIAGGQLLLETQDRGEGHRLHLPIDDFLRSLAVENPDNTIAVILSGTGSDGSRGIGAIKEAGGVVFAQAPESTTFDGMPLSAIQTGLVDSTAEPEVIAEQVAGLLSGAAPLVGSPAVLPEADSAELTRMFDLIGTRRGLDLRYLRRPMVLRRVARRIALLRLPDLDDYLGRLEGDPAEVDALTEDLLIGVTSFFRDPHCFDDLLAKHIPQLVGKLGPEDPFRAWVAGCSSGQEAYSLGITILEAMRASGIERPLSIYATDVNSTSLTRASKGYYTASEIADVPSHLLDRYFKASSDGFEVLPALRERMIFSPHNALTDPPFPRIHLVSCRNLMIYLDAQAQEVLLRNLFSALVPDVGMLFLGSAESPGPIAPALQLLNSRGRIYRRSGSLPKHAQSYVMDRPPDLSAADRMLTASRSPWIGSNSSRTAMLRDVIQAWLLGRDESGAVVDSQNHVVEVLADPNGLFRLPQGIPSTELSRVLDPTIVAAISTGQYRMQGGEPHANVVAAARKDESNGWIIHLEKIGESAAEGRSNTLLTIRPDDSDESQDKAWAAELVAPETANVVASLELQLQQTRESLQATIEELRSSSEEQQATNEELIASNEELQSTNEELRSVNEELATVNAEYQLKHAELLDTSAELDALLESLRVATLCLDRELKVAKFTRTITAIFPLRSHDIGRPIEDFSTEVTSTVIASAREVLETARETESEVRAASGRWMLMRTAPHRSLSNEDGIIVTFIDINRLKNAEQGARLMGAQLADANKKLTEQAEELEDLFSVMAHDLKRPVVSLDGLLELSEQGIESGDLERARRFLRQGRQASAKIGRTLQDIARFTAPGEDDARSERVDLRTFVRETLEPFEERAEQEGVALQLDVDEGTYTFQRAVAVGVLLNLVENAFVHGCTSESPRVEVSCRLDGDRLRIVVADNGQGIAPEHHQRVFEPFRRLKPDESEGSGIGLVAVKRFVQRAAGRVSLESQLGRGARFIAEFPARRFEDGSEDGSPEWRLLVVEDDSLDAKKMRLALDGSATITWVKSIEAAKLAAMQYDFHLVLLDLSLPDGHGLSLIEEVARERPELKFLIVSGQMEGMDRDIVATANVAGILPKDSMNDEDLRMAVEAVLQGEDR